jgi:hypothetical protein
MHSLADHSNREIYKIALRQAYKELHHEPRLRAAEIYNETLAEIQAEADAKRNHRCDVGDDNCSNCGAPASWETPKDSRFDVV